jgi:hypothetical protein
MTSFKNHIPVIGLASFLLLPMSGYAQWTVNEGATDYEITNTGTGGNPIPFTIEGGAPADIFYISSEGNLGLGAAPPTGAFSPRLNISDPTPDIELDDIDQNQTWQLFANGGDGSSDLGGIGFFDVTGNKLPFFIESAAPTASLLVKASGNVGVGVANPEYNLHVTGEGVGDVFPDTERILKLESSLAPEQIFENSTSGALWYFAMVSNDDFKISFDGTGKVEARFKPNGNLRIAGDLIQNSDRNSKMNIQDIDGKDILERVAALPISTWEYKADSGVKHLGPMAQDFHAAFGLGESPTGISTIDTGGVALAAIKGLKQEKDSQIEKLTADGEALVASNHRLQTQLRVQEERMIQLEMALAEVLRNQTNEVQVSSTK